MYKLGRLLRTLRYVKISQIYYRLVMRFYTPKIDRSPYADLKVNPHKLCRFIDRNESMLDQNRFNFLNLECSIENDFWGHSQSILWQYNLHYFDFLNSKNSHNQYDILRQIVQKWMDDHPPFDGVAWQPYPVSLRIVNWVKWIVKGNIAPHSMLQSIALHARWLSKRVERHLLGNHILANAKALIFAAILLPGTESKRWMQLGIAILQNEIDEQILPDGGHFELSPMYHIIILEDFLDMINMLRSECKNTDNDAAGEHIESQHSMDMHGALRQLESKIPKMLEWLQIMCHDDGEISFFNDAAFGIAPQTSEIMRYALDLGFDNQSTAPRNSVSLLPDTGFARLEQGPALVIADVSQVGPDYLPGHAHADTLSFEMSLFNERVIVNSGTSVYGESDERLRQRGTAAHSTLVLNEENSSEIWAGFRVGRRARPSDIILSYGDKISTAHILTDKAHTVKLSASHDGYKYLAGSPLHLRQWVLGDDRIIITDHILCDNDYKAAIYFHLHPRLNAVINDDTALIINPGNGQSIAQLYSSGAVISIEKSSYHPEFGVSIDNMMIKICYNISEIPEHQTIITWSNL